MALLLHECVLCRAEVLELSVRTFAARATPYIMWKLPTTLGPGIASKADNIHESQQPPASNLSAGPCRYFAFDHQRDRHAFILQLSRSQDFCRLCVSAKAKLSLAPGTGLSTSSEGAS